MAKPTTVKIRLNSTADTGEQRDARSAHTKTSDVTDRVQVSAKPEIHDGNTE